MASRLLPLALAVVALADEHQDCGGWAARGECDANPGFMLASCKRSCAAAQAEMAPPEGTFYDLRATNIDGAQVNFARFKGQVTLVTNVACFWGRTESHYAELVALHERYEGAGLRVVAFPCNQFGNQEPGTAAEIRSFARARGARFDIMAKVDVNGPGTCAPYKWLKAATRTRAIEWNFGTYFLVDRRGEATAYTPDKGPSQLEEYILSALHSEL